ncbi:MAG: SDR family NAD(P)-dependent oxidoreductase [Nocardioidaceae bacterium]
MTTVVLTGASRGIGLAAARALARHDIDLALVGRDPARVHAAAESARAEGGPGSVHEHVADLAEQADVRRLAAELRAHYPRIDVLANNAGAMFTTRRKTGDGIEETFALNHLAPFLLTHLLLDELRAGDGRVVTTASDAHRGGRLDPTDVQGERGPFRSFRAYGTSKLCNILFTRELQRRHPELTATCFHPGVIRSGFGKNDGLLARVGITLAGVFMSSPETGAETLVHLALDPEAGALKGDYLEKGVPVSPSTAARDDALARHLWEESARLTGLT